MYPDRVRISQRTEMYVDFLFEQERTVDHLV